MIYTLGWMCGRFREPLTHTFWPYRIWESTERNSSSCSNQQACACCQHTNKYVRACVFFPAPFSLELIRIALWELCSVNNSPKAGRAGYFSTIILDSQRPHRHTVTCHSVLSCSVRVVCVVVYSRVCTRACIMLSCGRMSEHTSRPPSPFTRD